MKRSRIDIRVREDVKQTWIEAAKKRGIDLTELIERQMLPITRAKVVNTPTSSLKS